VEITEVKNYIDLVKDELNKAREEVAEKYKKKFIKVKDVCSNYFSKYDADLEEV